MGAFTYPRSEPGSAGHMDLVEALQAHAAELQRLLAGIPDAAAAARPAEGEWSIKEIVCHLAIDAAFRHERLYRIIKLEEPRLPAYDERAELEKRNAQAARIDDLVSEFVAKRGETVEMLAELVHWNWARCGRHEERGRISVRQLVDLAIAHDEAHLATLRELAKTS